MKKPFSTYHLIVLFALIFSLLGAVCYGPIKQVERAESKQEKQSNEHVQKLTIAQHVLSNISFSLHTEAKFIHCTFEYAYFGLPFEVVHKIAPILFSISYLENLFPYTISAQAP